MEKSTPIELIESNLSIKFGLQTLFDRVVMFAIAVIHVVMDTGNYPYVCKL